MKKIFLLALLGLFTINLSFAGLVDERQAANTEVIVSMTDDTQSSDVQSQAPETKTGTPKSQLVALLLAFFFGYLGVHRFYLGYTTIGIIQLITGGGCGIWAFIDFIRIIMGDLKPADGSAYDPAL